MPVSMITPNDSVVWIQLCNVYCMKRARVSVSSLVSENVGFNQFPLITPGTQILTHPPGR